MWPNASIYYVSNVTKPNLKVSLIHTFDEVNAATGIIETEPDVFAFLAGKQSHLGIGINGTFGVWELDLRPTRGHTPGSPIIRELIHIDDAGLIISLIPVPNDPDSYLVSDSTMGVVWRVNLKTREYKLGIEADGMRSVVWAATQFGISTIEIHKGYLYWINTYTATIYRIPINNDGYPPSSAQSEVYKSVRTIYLDGFTFGPGDDDIIWAATNADNRLLAISPEKEVTFVAGYPDEMTLAGAVLPQFGKKCGDRNTLYIVTSGALPFPINGTVTEDGKLAAVDTKGLF